MNKLNELNIAELKDEEVGELMKFEKNLNQGHNDGELYVLVLKR